MARQLEEKTWMGPLGAKILSCRERSHRHVYVRTEESCSLDDATMVRIKPLGARTQATEGSFCWQTGEELGFRE